MKLNVYTDVPIHPRLYDIAIRQAIEELEGIVDFEPGRNERIFMANSRDYAALSPTILKRTTEEKKRFLQIERSRAGISIGAQDWANARRPMDSILQKRGRTEKCLDLILLHTNFFDAGQEYAHIPFDAEYGESEDDEYLRRVGTNERDTLYYGVQADPTAMIVVIGAPSERSLNLTDKAIFRQYATHISQLAMYGIAEVFAPSTEACNAKLESEIPCLRGIMPFRITNHTLEPYDLAFCDPCTARITEAAKSYLLK